ncbi:MAG: hypothetical protein ACR2NH_05225 [Solirubrobacteraceae bacterium]
MSVTVPGRRRRVSAPPPPSRAHLGLVAAAALLGVLAVWLAREQGAINFKAVSDIGRGVGAALLLFGLCGWALARLLVTGSLDVHRWALAFPIGAIASALALTVLGLLHVPYGAGLAIVLVAGLVSAVAVRVRLGPARVDPERSAAAGGWIGRVALPAWIAGLVIAVALIPVLREGITTVLGQNGDAVLAVGSAELVKHAPPGAERPELPLDRIPLVWRSKYPIFYSLAAVSTIAGLDTLQTFPLLNAVLLAFVALGFFLLAFHVLRTGWLGAVAVMALVPLNRMLLHVEMHTYYNQLWGSLALPFMLLTGWRFLRRPSRRTFGLFALFSLAGTFAYPLMLAFSAVFLLVAGLGLWRRERAAGRSPGWIRALRLPRAPRSRLAVIPLGLATLAVSAVLIRGVGEKTISATRALAPGGDLSGWSAPTVAEFPFHRYFGLLDPGALVWLAVLALLALAAYGLREAPREAAVALGVMIAGALAFALMFKLRDNAELFYFKVLGFTGPMALGLAVAGIVALARRGRAALVAAMALLAVLATTVSLNARRELSVTYAYASQPVLDLRDWGRELPPGATVRIDVNPNGYQLWAWYLLEPHPVSSTRPLVGFFPFPNPGTKGDFVLRETGEPPPRYAKSPPVYSNVLWTLYRMPRDIPGFDTSSRDTIESITRVPLG